MGDRQGRIIAGDYKSFGRNWLPRYIVGTKPPRDEQQSGEWRRSVKAINKDEFLGPATLGKSGFAPAGGKGYKTEVKKEWMNFF